MFQTYFKDKQCVLELYSVLSAKEETVSFSKMLMLNSLNTFSRVTFSDSDSQGHTCIIQIGSKLFHNSVELFVYHQSKSSVNVLSHN